MMISLSSSYQRIKRKVRSFISIVQGLPPIAEARAITPDEIRNYVDKPDPVILEIGCHDGGNTGGFLKVFSNPSIYCFEPDPRAIERFKKKYGNATRVHLLQMAVSDQDGKMTFHQSDGSHPKKSDEGGRHWDRSGSLRMPKRHLQKYPWVKFRESLLVDTITLDTWCKQAGVELIDFIWMDVQGAEMDVFQGATNVLSKTRYLYTEYNNRELYEGQSNLRQILAYLKDFRVVVRYPNDILLQNRNLI